MQSFLSSRFFENQHYIIWCIILDHAFLGICISFLFRYADIIMKIYSISMGIIFTTLLSSYFWDFEITVSFVLGYSVSVISCTLYYLDPKVLLRKDDEIFGSSSSSGKSGAKTTHSINGKKYLCDGIALRLQSQGC